MSSIEKLNDLLGGGDVKNVKDVKVFSVGQRRGFLGTMLAALAAGTGVLHLHNNSGDSVATKDPLVISNVKKEQIVVEQKNKIETPQVQETKFPLYGNFVKDEKLKTQIEQMGNFVLPEGMKPNQIARYVAQKMFKEKTYAGYTTALISEREGFVSSLYNDVGWYAVGNGANLGVQSQSHIKNVFGTISTDKQYIDNFANLSGKHVDGIVPRDYKNMNISPQRSIQVAMVMSQTYENSIINSFSKQVGSHEKAKELFESLKDNEKAALVNIAYQKGSLSSSEAKGIVNYAKDPNKTPEKALAAIDAVTITYVSKGVRVRDTRSETLFKSLFSNPSLFEKIISGNIKPKDLATYSSIFKGHTKSSSSGEVVLDDPIGTEKEKALSEGRVWKGVIAPSVDVNAMRPNPKGWKGFSYGM